MFHHDDVTGFGSESRVYRTYLSLKQALALHGRLDRRKELVSITHLRQARPESHLNQDNRHPSRSCNSQNA